MSGTRTIIRDGRQWDWPAYDTELIKVFDQHRDISRILEYVTDYSCCVQAGGACGVWPYYLSRHFDQVNTFEPDITNYWCLKANAPDCFIRFGALGNSSGHVRIERDGSEATNAGAGYAVDTDVGAPVYRIDDLLMYSCGLIQLDVEGGEHDALLGGEQTIREFKPVVAIEEKPLPHKPDCTEARRLLESWGYVERERVHRDVIFTC